MISDFSEYYRLAAYLFRYTQRRIGLAMGAQNLHAIFDEPYYTKLDGGILESFGRLFKQQPEAVRLSAPGPEDRQDRHHRHDAGTGALRQLYGYLVGRRCIVQLTRLSTRSS